MKLKTDKSVRADGGMKSNCDPQDEEGWNFPPYSGKHGACAGDDTVGGRRTIATEANAPASYMALASAARDTR